ncbi:cyclic nucleotide-binding domain-containing protein [Streptomyces sp. NPDC050658]|uniref:cyclic nucleotide-binding domain-containing protein n=1 Tax=unclassified Streptomyces TaxID=2593676 RepID=UPI003419EBBD
MTTATTPRVTKTLSAEHRGSLMAVAREVSFPQGLRLFNEGGRADRFWIIRSGSVALDLRVPGRRPAVIETLGSGDLVGWSWLFAPHVWQLGADTETPVRAWEFDAETVRELCRADPAMGAAVARWIGKVLAHRLAAARTRLLDLYAPYGSGRPA